MTQFVLVLVCWIHLPCLPRLFFCEWRLTVLWQEDGWMGGMEGSAWWGRERWRLRHITFPQCIKGTGLSVTHTVRLGRGGGDGEERRSERRAEGGGEGDREKGGGEERERERAGKEESGLFFFCLTFHFLFFPIAPSPISDVIQVTYSSQRGSLPPLPLLSLFFFLSLSLLLPLFLPRCSADWLNAWMNRPLSFLLRWGRGWHRKPWGRRRAREEERMSDKEEREGGWESFHGIWTDIHWLLISSVTCEAVAIVFQCMHLCGCTRRGGERTYGGTLFHPLKTPRAHSLPLCGTNASSQSP